MEPVIGNEPAIDLDYHCSGSRKRTVLFCMNEGKPALTDRLRLVQEKSESAFGVVLMHPGFNETDTVAELRAAEYEELQEGYDGYTDVNSLDIAAFRQVWPQDLASIVIRIPDLLRRAGKSRGEPSVVYLYDKSDSSGSSLFLGAAEIIPQVSGLSEMKYLPEATHEEMLSNISKTQVLLHEEVVDAANKQWIVCVHSVEGTYQANILFVMLGGIIIFVASCALAVWMYSSQRRFDKYNKERSLADAERASLIIDNAQQATRAERELNDFIAQYVQVPVDLMSLLMQSSDFPFVSQICLLFCLSRLTVRFATL
jgi:hypothetical protein